MIGIILLIYPTFPDIAVPGGFLGSQSRRKGSRGARRGGRSGSGSGGGGGGGTDDEKREEKQSREEKRLYRRAEKKIAAALTERNFSYAAEIATSATLSLTPVQDAVSLLIAGAKAYREGKNQDWRAEPSELAIDSILYAREKTGYELPTTKQELFNKIIAANLRKSASEQNLRKT